MTARVFSSSINRLNNALPYFSDATKEDMFEETELLSIFEYALPNSWRKQFDLNGYTPTDENRARLLKECEIMERFEGKTSQQPEKTKRKRDSTTTTTKANQNIQPNHMLGEEREEARKKQGPATTAKRLAI